MSVRRLTLAIPALLVGAAVPASAGEAVDPLSFFEGVTETEGTVRVVLRKPYHTRSIGRGRIERDGSLTLVQRVIDDGKAPRERRWSVRATAPGRFRATMSEAVGPVAIEQVGARYRFRFKMKGKLSAEQWLTPLAGGRAARNSMSVRRMGITVATTEGVIRKI